MPIKINLKSALLYIIYAAACVFLNGAVSGVPLSLGLYFSLLICGGSALAAPIIYIACSAVHFSLAAFLCALFEAGFLLAVTLIYRRTGKKIRFEAAAYAAVALAPFILFADGAAEGALSFISSGYAVRAVAAAVVLIFFLFSFKSVYALMFRAGRCRLKEDEYVCLAALYAGAGVGAINLAGTFAYFAFATFASAMCVRFYRTPAAIICGIAVGAPLAVYSLSLSPVTAFVLICSVSLAFVRLGRAAPCTAVFALACLYAYTLGWFSQGAALTAIRVIVTAICCAIAAIPSPGRLKRLMDAMTVKRVLPDTAVNRERERTGERLYKISEVFREIENAFKSLNEEGDGSGAKRRVLAELKERLCKNCERRSRCAKTDVYDGFSNLVETGTVKGKVNLIDLPPAVTRNCSFPADLIRSLNLLLAEYRRFMTEAENARAGRLMLADQAKGVCCVLKDCATDLCRRKRGGEEFERQITAALASAGIACPEAYADGEENEEICTVIVGRANADVISETLFKVTGERFTLKDKLDYDGDKRCYIFCRPPAYDAVFGVAAAKREGEKASGDTHSVIRIDEHRFLMALSDGMGSGEYANKVSRTAISLIEAFYRAGMPEGTVLETINKLIAFSGDERFACIDICAVNLNTGEADFVKIGSPAALILREAEIKLLESESLPLGILEALRPTVARETLKDGDILVFMSDGITSAFGSNPELIEFVQPLKPLNPQNLADRLLQEAIKRTGGHAGDDMTVLCTRIFSTADIQV